MGGHTPGTEGTWFTFDTGGTSRDATIGVKVLDFLESEPEHPHAIEILAEMERMSEKSWPSGTEGVLSE